MYLLNNNPFPSYYFMDISTVSKLCCSHKHIINIHSFIYCSNVPPVIAWLCVSCNFELTTGHKQTHFPSLTILYVDSAFSSEFSFIFLLTLMPELYDVRFVMTNITSYCLSTTCQTVEGLFRPKPRVFAIAFCPCQSIHTLLAEKR